MKRLVLGLGLLVVCGVAVGLWFGWPLLTDLLRRRLERELTAALGAASRIEQLTIALFPPGVHLGAVVVGAAPPLATVTSIDVRLWALASLAEGRPVLSARIAAPAVDLSHLPKGEAAARAPHGE